MNDNKPSSHDLQMNEVEQIHAEIETIERATVDDLPVGVDPEIADQMGAFAETALDDFDAEDSQFDVDANGEVLS